MSTQPQFKSPAEEIAWYKGENARLLAEKSKTHVLRCKVSAKGALSVYGLGRWPVTLYQEQWESLLAFAEQIKAFLAANRSVLKRKGDADEPTEAPEQF